MTAAHLKDILAVLAEAEVIVSHAGVIPTPPPNALREAHNAIKRAQAMLKLVNKDLLPSPV